jgi:pimeloyl-ACP methyl ester carboxylesterase
MALPMTGPGQSARARDRLAWLALLCATAVPAAPIAAPSQSSGRSTAIAVAPLGPCGPQRPAAYTSAECSAIRVFENRRTKQGRTIDVAFARWRAETQPAAGAVFFLAGGPGAGGGSVADSVRGWASPLRATLDLVVVDQRGTWFSNALHCARDVDAQPALAFGHIFDPGWVRECRRLLERTADLRLYSTELAAEDLDDVRAELGYERIGVYGGSYGTRLAQAYMRRYPDRTRAVVLDAALPFDVKVPLTYAATAQGALEHLGKSHPKLQAEFARVLDRFQAGPIRTSVTPPGQPPVPVLMSRGDFGYTVRGILYRPDQLDQLPDWISRAAATGDMATLAQRYWERALTFSRTFATGLHFSILCSEDAAFIGEGEIDAAAARAFLGRYVIDEYRNACALWPVAPVSAEFRKPVASAVPTLLISGAYDPVTPPAFADRIAASLTKARHLVSPTASHGSVGGCASSAAVHVLRTGTLAGMPDSCR